MLHRPAELSCARIPFQDRRRCCRRSCCRPSNSPGRTPAGEQSCLLGEKGGVGENTSSVSNVMRLHHGSLKHRMWHLNAARWQCEHWRCGCIPLNYYKACRVQCAKHFVDFACRFYVLVCEHYKPHVNRAEVIRPPHPLVVNVVHQFTSCRPLISTLRSGVTWLIGIFSIQSGT